MLSINMYFGADCPYSACDNFFQKKNKLKKKHQKNHLYCTELLFFLTTLIKAQSTNCATSHLSYSHFCFGGSKFFERTYMNTECHSIIECYFFLLQIFCGTDKFQIKAHFPLNMGKSNEIIIY